MAKSKPATKTSKHSKLRAKDVAARNSNKPVVPAEALQQATTLAQSGQPDTALAIAQRALHSLSAQHGTTSTLLLPALTLIGEIQLQLGDAPAALQTFLSAVAVDPLGSVPESEGGGAESFLWLAQLNEEGGQQSISWFEKGIKVLEEELKTCETRARTSSGRSAVDEKRKRIAEALCGEIEVWMTDLSFEDEAESQCESLITQAMLMAPESDSQTLQTLASIRLSQGRLEDAQSALESSVEKWLDKPLGSPEVPDFSARISLVRLLMEAEMEETALEVVERLVGEDDESVEAWYLGGWCLWLMGQDDTPENKDGNESMSEDDGGGEDENEAAEKERTVLLMSSREWLRNCLKLYTALQYEDERLRDHAKELVEGLDAALGDKEIESDEEGEDEWEGIESDDEGGSEQQMDES